MRHPPRRVRLSGVRLFEFENGSRGLVAQAVLIWPQRRVRSSGLPLRKFEVRRVKSEMIQATNLKRKRLIPKVYRGAVV